MKTSGFFNLLTLFRDILFFVDLNNLQVGFKGALTRAVTIFQYHFKQLKSFALMYAQNGLVLLTKTKLLHCLLSSVALVSDGKN